MKREDIEKATEKAVKAYKPEFPSDTNIYAEGYMDGFIDRVNSTYHDATEQPENGRTVLAFSETRYPVIAGPNNRKWDELAKDFDIVRWAYTDDLMPYIEEKGESL